MWGYTETRQIFGFNAIRIEELRNCCQSCDHCKMAKKAKTDHL